MIINTAIRTLLSVLLLNNIAALSLSRFDEQRDSIRNKDDDFNDSPPPPNLRMGPAVIASDVEEGVSFTRNINLFPADAAFVMSLADDDCKQHDVFGDNDCHFSWGQNVTGKFNVKFSDQIEEGDYIVGDFKVGNELVIFDLNEFVHTCHLNEIIFSRTVSLSDHLLTHRFSCAFSSFFDSWIALFPGNFVAHCAVMTASCLFQ
jgi:hypothetical protein